MVSKDQAIGGAILTVCTLVAVVYTIVIFGTTWLYKIPKIGSWLLNNPHLYNEVNLRIWAVVIPVFIAFIAIMVIGAWIGYTMATTPPPKPIEEITTEIEDKKEK
jgi:formate hydrogenlyase subunit 3/multisubunit Na+/H+ antiporter MnhD subunit